MAGPCEHYNEPDCKVWCFQEETCTIERYWNVNKVKWSRYRPGVAQSVGRGTALLFHDRGTRRGWAVSSTPRPHFTPGKDTLPILQEAGRAPGPVWTCGKSRPPRDSIPDRPACSQSLYRLSYPAHTIEMYKTCNNTKQDGSCNKVYDLHCWGIRFKFRRRYRLCWSLSWLSSFRSDKYGILPHIKSGPFLSHPFQFIILISKLYHSYWQSS